MERGRIRCTPSVGTSWSASSVPPSFCTSRQLKNEEETRRRAEAALKAVRQEKVRQADEATRQKMYTKRTGGGFVVSFAKEQPPTPRAAPSDA